MKKSQTQEDLELLESGVVPMSMDFRLPEVGVVFFEPDKVSYNMNTTEFWLSRWDSVLLEQFPCLQEVALNLAHIMEVSGKTPLDEINERQNNNILEESITDDDNRLQLCITEKTEIIDTLHSA